MKLKTIVLPLGILAVGVLVAVGLAALKQPPEEKPVTQSVPEVEVIERVPGPIQVQVESHGVMSAREQTTLVAQVSGTITYIHPAFVRGGQVEPGTVMLRIDDSDYQSALLDAEAALAAAVANLETEQAQAKVAREQLQGVDNPTVLALRKPQLAQARAAVKASQAQVQRAQRDLQRTEVKAPFAALVVERQPGLGSYVTPGSPLGTVYAMDRGEVRLPIAARHWQQLVDGGLGASVTLTLEQGDARYDWPATIVRSEGLVDDASRMHFLVAQVEQPYQFERPLRFGEYVSARIEGRSYDNSIRIPYQWLRNDRLPLLTNGELNLRPVSLVRLEGEQAILQLPNNEPLPIVTTALQYPSHGMALKRMAPTMTVATEGEGHDN
ncbi:hypothetical protein GCM10011297_13630 [Bacterioplanes sanyensis]|uniref:efflux RND transporter periplasmic adaptor subunit n=1 Tax=Bacterioplanes sanyensis TaxID=1249553 RepID=UPI001673A80E|nr:efflux RND transporter periplasmic adaptor subunit [Bacterioplanes sanyensis]GGY41887.1 hypothetical protein GCM10011297_13630 [Bacterioplanes sanyensis]